MSGQGELLGRAYVDLGPLQQSLSKAQGLTRTWLDSVTADTQRLNAGTVIGVKVDDRAALAGLGRISAAQVELTARHPTLEVDADVEAALRGVGDVQRTVTTLAHQHATIPLDAEASPALLQIHRVAAPLRHRGRGRKGHGGGCD